MDIKVILTIDREDIEEYKEACGNEILTDKEVLESYEEMFYDDYYAYISDAEIEIEIKEN